jgi:hypothetical protein
MSDKNPPDVREIHEIYEKTQSAKRFLLILLFETRLNDLKIKRLTEIASMGYKNSPTVKGERDKI